MRTLDHQRTVVVGGPYFDRLSIGQVFEAAPTVTLTDGLAAAHRAIVGNRLRLTLDRSLAATVAGGPVAHPGLVTDIAIGQSTLATHHVIANLFYRGLRLHRLPLIGDTLSTTTEVVGLKSNSIRPGRPATGLAVLRISTTDQHGRTVLDFHRCAMLPIDPAVDPAEVTRTDDLSTIGESNTADWAVPEGIDLDAYRSAVPGPHFDPSLAGVRFTSSGDVVSSAPELARLTLNIAATHHDERTSATGRLVYGGHTIGIALDQAARALPNLVTVLGWQSCDHTAPVAEGDTLTSDLYVEGTSILPTGGTLDLRSVVFSHRRDAPPQQVLDWRFTALFA
ncbi:MaoC family dehydratase [Nocardia carnea]|uniref:MaoC family dehydratase n=1 Tax=Nocardia carnea TaxID=37328 RepID=UPI0024539EC7|nr:MaoC family dehydratase [Nocardia carnea]